MNKLRVTFLCFFVCATVLLSACGASEQANSGNGSSPQWAQKSVFYEIFTRSFYDGNGDGVGDFQGVEQKLDYLKDLGVDAVWLTPIHPSPTYHGYDVSDYETVNPDFGTMADFDRMVKSAHKKGIRVIIDFVVNHTSTQHSWFQKALAGDAEYADYYLWSDTKLSDSWGLMSNGKYCYFSFGPGSGMPDLNYNNEKVRSAIKTIAKKWLGHGIDGFRLDVPQEIGDGDDEFSVDWWVEFQKYVRGIKSDAYIVGEVNYDQIDTGNANIAPFLAGMDSAFDFPLYNLEISRLSGIDVDILSVLNATRAAYTAVNPDAGDAIILGNHDRNRIASELNFNAGKIRSSIALLFTLPGTPFIYYGDEIGMRGGHDLQGDPNKREPFDWYTSASGTGMTSMTKATYGAAAKNLVANDGISLEEEINDTASIYAYYKKMIAIRKTNKILFDGEYTRIGTPAKSYGYMVTSDNYNYSLCVIHNNSSSSVSMTITADAVTELCENAKYVKDDAAVIPAYGCIILKCAGTAKPVEDMAIIEDPDKDMMCNLTVNVHAPSDTPSGSNLYMPNSEDGWDEAVVVTKASQTLTRIDDYNFTITVQRKKGTRMEYKFFRGSWSTSETDEEGNWTGNRVFLFGEAATTVDAYVSGWRDVDYKGE